LERIVHIGSDPGDVVLDFFGGSGTTAAVAHKMGRRWVTVEASSEVLDKYTIPRLTKVVEGKDAGGVTRKVGWTGGGGFRVLRVGPSTAAPGPESNAVDPTTARPKPGVPSATGK
jgi:adenine-specific DNA-methyltransferase